MKTAQQLVDLKIDSVNKENKKNQSIMTLQEEECEETGSGKLRSIIDQRARP